MTNNDKSILKDILSYFTLLTLATLALAVSAGVVVVGGVIAVRFIQVVTDFV